MAYKQQRRQLNELIYVRAKVVSEKNWDPTKKPNQKKRWEMTLEEQKKKLRGHTKILREGT